VVLVLVFGHLLLATGAGTTFTNLINVPLIPKSVAAAIFVITLDLSKIFIFLFDFLKIQMYSYYYYYFY
jgi:hypothetical protein